MPYSSTRELPPAVHKLPVAAQKVFMGAFNGSYKDQGEESAFKIAWSAVRRAGYVKNERTGKYIKRDKEIKD